MNWFSQKQKRNKVSGLTGKKLSNRRRRENRLGYDKLEQRLALTAYVVNSTIDDATGTVDGLIGLREAVIAANTNMVFGDAPAGEATGDEIRFSIAGQTATLTEGEISISDDLKILGMNSNLTYNAGGSNRVFSINVTNQIVAIARLTLTGGQASQGGAISSTGFGEIILNEMTFNNNVATGLGGGAVYHETGTLSIVDSVFSNNRATSSSGRGGAIYLDSGRLSVTRGEMVSNSAGLTGGAIEVNGGDVFLTNAQIGLVGQGNTAGASNSNGRGGGIHVASSSANTYVNGGEFNSNTASREGGGLWNQTDATMLIQANARVINNVASGAAVDDGGGGIFNNGGYLVVNQSTVSSNMADGALGSGGGILSTSDELLVQNSTVAANVANRAGGGIEIITGTVYVVNSTLGGSGTQAGNIAGPSGSANPGNGGGLHISGGMASVYVLNTSVQNNVAASEGGGLWNQTGSLLRLDNNSSILNNRATGSASNNGGGGIFNNGGSLTIGNSTINANQADGTQGSGGGIFSTDGTVLVFDSTINANAAARAGGGIEIIDGFINLSNVNVTSNTAGIAFTPNPGIGGGLHVSGFNTTQVVVDGGTFSNNVAVTQGGGLWNEAGSTLFLKGGVQIQDNLAAGGSGSSGGGIYNKGHVEAVDTFFSAASFSRNKADLGGGFHNSSGTANLINVDFLNNEATDLGGGIYNNNYMVVQDSLFQGNIAGNNGGGIFNTQFGRVNMTGNTFNGNIPNDIFPIPEA